MIININLKVTVKFWASEMMYVELWAQNLRNMYSNLVVNVFEAHTLMCREHTSTMSPVNKIQDHDYLHQVNGNYQIWSLRGDVYRNESPKAT